MAEPKQPTSPSSQQLLVSVVIPVYNNSRFIADAVKSALNQTLSWFEIIVVNDGSPDTPELEAALQPYLPRVRYFRQENRGPSAARNLGVRESIGRYVAFLDSDDLWLPDHLAEQVRSLQSDSGLGLIYTNYSQIDRDGYTQAGFDPVRQDGPVTFENLLALRCTVITSSAVVRRELLLGTYPFDEQMRRCEDFDLWLRLAGNGVKMAYNPRVHMLRRRTNGLSSDRELMTRARREVYEKVQATLPLTPAQTNIVTSRLRELDKEIEIEAAKRHLRAGSYAEALAAVKHARSLSPDRRLGFAETALRISPGLFRWTYEHYLQVLHSLKQRFRARWEKGRTVVEAVAKSQALKRSRVPICQPASAAERLAGSQPRT